MSDSSSAQYIDVYNQAVKYIGMRSHTVFELKTKLNRKKYPINLIDSAIKELQTQKYVNDKDFAQVFTQNLIKYKTFGYYGIKNKLKARGLSDQICEEILSEELDAETEKKIAQKAIGKSPRKEKIKLMQMLQRKGFRMQAISPLLGDYSED